MIAVFNKKNDCCGCTACKHICPKFAIEMQPDEEGFLYPEINQQLCIDCGLCKKVCVFQNGYETTNNYNPPKVYAAKNKDEDTRMNSTSGGVFTAISDNVLMNNGLVFGAVFNENMEVIHKVANKSDERNRFRGSKYVQSDLKNVYMEIKQQLNEDVQILFTGTPCQTAGLKSFLGNENTEKLILCDIVCHGVPSPLIWREHLAQIESISKNKIVAYNFRDKTIGWRGANITINLKDRIWKNNHLARTYSNLYFSHYIIRPACHNCKYTNTERPSDITIADFWGIEKNMPDFDDNKGVSLVLVNSYKGLRLLESVEDRLVIRVSNVKDCLQPQLSEPTKPSLKRLEFWNAYHTYGYEYVVKLYGGYNVVYFFKMIIKSLLMKIGIFSIVQNLRKVR